MSKSYGNAIFLKDSEEEIASKIARMFTDPKRIYRKDPGHPDECPVFAYRKLVSNHWQDVKQECLSAKIGCVDCKKQMAEELNHYLIPVREKRKIFEKNPEQVWEILKKGQRKAQSVAQQTMENVRKLVGLEL